ncbi:MAG: recombinase family protein [Acholeplasmataceae bacterium]
MHYLIYARVSPKGSSWNASETSIPDQIAQCRAYALARDPSATFTTARDQFAAAGSCKCTELQAAMDALRAGRATWDTLIVRHIDRLARSLGSGLDILRALEEHGKGLISTTQALDLSTPTGRAMLHIILAFGQWERDMCSERTRLRMTQIARAGNWPSGNPPYGYRRPGPGQNNLIPHPAHAPIVRALYTGYAAGAGSTELARRHGLSKMQVLRILRDETYLGRICYDGQTYPGNHEPLISEPLFRSVQTALPGSRHAPRPRSQKYPYLLTGLVYCTCGRVMTPASARGRTARYHYYECTDHKGCRPRTPAPALETTVLDALATTRIDAALLSRACDSFQSAWLADHPRPDTAQLDRDLSRALADRDRLKALFTSGIVTAANAELFNADLSAANARVQELTGQRDAPRALTDPATSELFSYRAFLADFSRLPARLSELRDRPDLLRALLHATVARIKKTGQGQEDFDVLLNLPGSPNCTELAAHPTLKRTAVLRIAAGSRALALTVA